MQLLELATMDVFIGDDFFKEEQERHDPEFRTFEEQIETLLKMQVFDHLSVEKDAYLEEMKARFRRKNKKLGVLLAHGECAYLNKQRNWVYYDGSEQKLVQDWVVAKDGLYFCLLLCSCNEGSITVTAKKSVLLIPDEVVSGMRAINDMVHWSIMHPRKGEIDDYVVGYELEQMRR